MSITNDANASTADDVIPWPEGWVENNGGPEVWCTKLSDLSEQERQFYDPTWTFDRPSRTYADLINMGIRSPRVTYTESGEPIIRFPTWVRGRTDGKKPSDGKDAAKKSTAIDQFPLQDERNRNEIHLSSRLVSEAASEFLYIPSEKKYRMWDGKRWIFDTTMQFEKRAKRVLPGVLAEIEKSIDVFEIGEEEAEKLFKFYDRSNKDRVINAITRLARIEIAADPASFNRDDEYLLNVENGTLDLKTFDLLPHDRERRITRLCPVTYDPHATAPLFEQFIFTATGGDRALISYIATLLGLGLTGSTAEQQIVMLIGGGGTGKSTLLKFFLELLGNDYAMKAPYNFLSAKGKETQHPTMLMDLMGMRLVATIETDENQRIAEALIKELTGGDSIRARHCNKDFSEFKPTHKLWLVSNHLPEVRGTDSGIWRRIRVIPFNHPFIAAEAKEDKEFITMLRGELPGFLNWCLAGLKDYAVRGLETPAVVSEMTSKFRESRDTISEFVNDCCVVEQSSIRSHVGRVTSRDIYEAYVQYVGRGAESMKRFSDAMEKRFGKIKSSSVYFPGIDLLGEWKCRGVGVNLSRNTGGRHLRSGLKIGILVV